MESIKEKFHVLIDGIEDENKLDACYSIIFNLLHQEKGSAYEKLSAPQKLHLDQSYAQSFDKSKLIPHSEFKKTYSKWLTQ